MKHCRAFVRITHKSLNPVFVADLTVHICHNTSHTQPVSQSVSGSINQSVSRLVSQSVGESVNQSADQFLHQSHALLHQTKHAPAGIFAKRAATVSGWAPSSFTSSAPAQSSTVWLNRGLLMQLGLLRRAANRRTVPEKVGRYTA